MSFACDMLIGYKSPFRFAAVSPASLVVVLLSPFEENVLLVVLLLRHASPPSPPRWKRQIGRWSPFFPSLTSLLLQSLEPLNQDSRSYTISLLGSGTVDSTLDTIAKIVANIRAHLYWPIIIEYTYLKKERQSYKPLLASRHIAFFALHLPCITFRFQDSFT